MLLFINHCEEKAIDDQLVCGAELDVAVEGSRFEFTDQSFQQGFMIAGIAFGLTAVLRHIISVVAEQLAEHLQMLQLVPISVLNKIPMQLVGCFLQKMTIEFSGSSLSLYGLADVVEDLVKRLWTLERKAWNLQIVAEFTAVTFCTVGGRHILKHRIISFHNYDSKIRYSIFYGNSLDFVLIS
jgi:hypothetical protein